MNYSKIIVPRLCYRIRLCGLSLKFVPCIHPQSWSQEFVVSEFISRVYLHSLCPDFSIVYILRVCPQIQPQSLSPNIVPRVCPSQEFVPRVYPQRLSLEFFPKIQLQELFLVLWDRTNFEISAFFHFSIS